MSIYAFKPKFQNLLRPLVRQLYRRGITANQITLAACAISVGIGILLSLSPYTPILFWLMPAWLFVRMALNAADGMLAREFGQRSALGGYLNEITDIAADAALYLPFDFISPFGSAQVALFIWLSAMTEFCGILKQVPSNGRRYDDPFGKSDRTFFIGALATWYGPCRQLPHLAPRLNVACLHGIPLYLLPKSVQRPEGYLKHPLTSIPPLREAYAQHFTRHSVAARIIYRRIDCLVWHRSV